MAKQAGFRIKCVIKHGGKLMGDVPEVFYTFKAVCNKTDGVLRIEGLCHVKAVQPHLIGIYLLVPEAAFRSAGLVQDLAVEAVHCCAVLLFTGYVIKLEQRTARADVVCGEVGLLVLVDYTCAVNYCVVPGVNVVKGLLRSCVQHGFEFKAGGVVPFELSFLAVYVAGFRVTGHLAADNFKRQRSLGRACGQGCNEYYNASSHLLLYGSQIIPSSF